MSKDPGSYAAVRAAVKRGETLVGYERANGLRSLAPKYYAAEVELGIAAEIAPSLFAKDGTPKTTRLGAAIRSARKANVRWSRIAIYLGIPETRARDLAAKAGYEPTYVGLGRRYGLENGPND